jgi:uncharacterized membrane protein YidH (DUF202 family)
MAKENREKTNEEQRSQQHLANERTFLSWLRTCIALIGLGFIAARLGFFLEQFGLVVRSGESRMQTVLRSLLSHLVLEIVMHEKRHPWDLPYHEDNQRMR